LWARGASTSVSQTVRLNTPGKQDGGFTLIVDGETVVQREDVYYRGVSSAGGNTPGGGKGKGPKYLGPGGGGGDETSTETGTGGWTEPTPTTTTDPNGLPVTVTVPVSIPTGLPAGVSSNSKDAADGGLLGLGGLGSGLGLGGLGSLLGGGGSGRVDGKGRGKGGDGGGGGLLGLGILGVDPSEANQTESIFSSDGSVQRREALPGSGEPENEVRWYDGSEGDKAGDDEGESVAEDDEDDGDDDNELYPDMGWDELEHSLFDTMAADGAGPVGFTGIFFSTFFGGHSAEWATPRDQYAWFGDFGLSVDA
jgi:hypothetical protein